MYQCQSCRWTLIRCLILAVLFFAQKEAGTSPQPDADNAYWDDRFQCPGLQQDVCAIAFDDAGNMYVGIENYSDPGFFSPNGIAKWDGRIWSELGSGLTGSIVAGHPTICWAALPIGTDVYAGGTFLNAGLASASCIARWDGSRWWPVGAGFNGPVYDLEWFNGQVCAAGAFTASDSVGVNRIARWNGSDWQPLGEGCDAGVYAMEAVGSDLYVGGGFTSAGGVAANHVARWNGSSWSSVGGGMNGSVSAFAVWNGHLYAGGSFTVAGSTVVNHIARWNGSAWVSVGSGVDGGVSDLASTPDGLYAVGSFETAGGVSAVNVAKWNGVHWEAVQGGVGDPGNSSVGVAEASGSEVCVGGLFDCAGDTYPTWNIAKWDGAEWTTFGWGVAGPGVDVLTVAGDDVYVGGGMYVVGGIDANNIAKWNGETWTALGPGLENEVYAIAVDGTEVYAAGGHRSSSGHYVSEWNGVEWQDLGDPIDTLQIRALAVVGTDVYAGFQGGLLRWDGSSWTVPGEGVPGDVYALVASGTDLYIGGTAGVTRWDGSVYHPLGSGVNGTVEALTLDGDGHLYVGGSFTTAGGLPASSIAKWDGSSWTPVGTGEMAYVKSLAVSGHMVYAGGWFQKEGGYLANGVAVWDGEAWSEFGSGIDHAVNAIAVVGNTLVAGGRFLEVGGKEAYNLARWIPRVSNTTFTLSESPVPKETVETPDAVIFGENRDAFYQPALILEPGTTIGYPGGLPVDVTMEMADEIRVGGGRINGAFTISPSGVTFGGTGASLRIEFSEHDAELFGGPPGRFRAARLSYPNDYPANKAAIVEILSDDAPVPVRIRNRQWIYGITVPITETQSTYGAVPLWALPVTGAEFWQVYE